MPKVLRLGTRGSQLAMTQSQQMADAVQVATDVVVELVVITTRGDRIQDKPLPEIGGKGLFTAELEAALLNGSIDFAELRDLVVLGTCDVAAWWWKMLKPSADYAGIVPMERWTQLSGSRQCYAKSLMGQILSAAALSLEKS